MISVALLACSGRLEPEAASAGGTSMYTALPSVHRRSCKLQEAASTQMHSLATRLVLSEEGHLCCHYEAFDGGPIDSSGR